MLTRVQPTTSFGVLLRFSAQSTFFLPFSAPCQAPCMYRYMYKFGSQGRFRRRAKVTGSASRPSSVRTLSLGETAESRLVDGRMTRGPGSAREGSSSALFCRVTRASQAAAVGDWKQGRGVTDSGSVPTRVQARFEKGHSSLAPKQTASLNKLHPCARLLVWH